MARIPLGAPPTTSQRRQPIAAGDGTSSSGVDRALHGTPEPDCPRYLAEAEGQLDEVQQLSAGLENRPLQKAVRDFAGALGGLARFHHTKPAKAVAKFFASPQAKVMIQMADKTADNKVRETPGWGAPPERLLSLRETELRALLATVLAQVGKQFAAAVQPLAEAGVKAGADLDTAIAKAEAIDRLPAGYVERGADLPGAIALAQLSEDIKLMMPSERLENFRDLLAIGDPIKIRQFIRRATQHNNILLRKGSKAILEAWGSGANANVLADKEIANAHELRRHMAMWEAEHEDGSITLARVLRDKLLAAFRALVGVDPRQLTDEQFARYYLGSTTSLEVVLAKPYTILDPPERLATRFALPDKLAMAVRR